MEFFTKKYCLQCKKELSKVRKYFCTRKCRDIYRANRKYIVKTCSYCKKEFQTYRYLTDKGFMKFCSHKCQLDSHKNGKILKCKQCEKEFYTSGSGIKRGREFCSNRCSADSRKVIKIKLKCDGCEKSIFRTLKQMKRQKTHYCSYKCYKKTVAAILYPRICRNCRKKFFIQKYANEHCGGVFCSKKCRIANIKPNNSELALFNLVNEIAPGEYKLNVNGGLKINNKIPDIVNVNGQKKVIELFGEHVHPKEDEQKRKELFKEYGYDTLVVWSIEIYSKKKLRQKLIEFHNKDYMLVNSL